MGRRVHHAKSTTCYCKTFETSKYKPETKFLAIIGADLMHNSEKVALYVTPIPSHLSQCGYFFHYIFLGKQFNTKGTPLINAPHPPLCSAKIVFDKTFNDISFVTSINFQITFKGWENDFISSCDASLWFQVISLNYF